MGFYAEHIFPRILDVVINTGTTRQIRSEVCAPLRGEVVEIGFGTGHNLPFMPPTVTRLLAVDPMAKGRDLARDRIEAAPFPVEFVGLDGQDLPLGDASADTALSTWTLCSLHDPVAAVREVRRVLRPGGTFRFAEHGLAPEPRVQRWQHRCNGLQKRIACGCNLDRDIPAVLTAGGMSITELCTFYAKGDPKVMGWTYQGAAVAD